MTLYLRECALDSIVRHSEGGYPDEVCGVLLGKEVEGRRTVQTMMPIENSFSDGERYHRFLITPQAMLQAEKMARLDRLDVLGVYHSHPDSPATPSEYDRDHAAWTTWSYIIMSVREGRNAGLHAWKLREDRSAFDEEEVIIEG